MRGLPWIVAALGLFYGGGPGAAPITGRVIDADSQAGISGVTIRVLLSGNSWIVPEGTAADGAFSFELTDGFTPAALDTEFLNLEFDKAGFRKATRMRRATERGVFVVDELRVKLDALAENTGRSADASTAAITENSPRRIFHSAYELFGGDQDAADSALENLNQRLPRHLRRGIITHLQRLQLPVNIALDPVPEDVALSDSIKLRAFAQSNDALAVILGEAELTVNAGNEAIELASEYRIIPQLPGFQPGTLFVDDRIPKTDFRPSRLSRSLSQTWGGTTVFALALYEARAALQQSDPDKRSAGLSRAESYLKAEKSSLSGLGMLNQQIDGLLALIERERKQ